MGSMNARIYNRLAIAIIAPIECFESVLDNSILEN